MQPWWFKHSYQFAIFDFSDSGVVAIAFLQHAADVLDIDQATLWRRRKTYGI